jgi:hypothetical protein
MPHIIISGRVLSGKIETAPDGDLVRCEASDWKATGLHIGQVVELKASSGRGTERVIRSVMSGGDADVWVWFERVRTNLLARTACKRQRSLINHA